MAKIFPMAVTFVGLTIGSAMAQAPPPAPDCSAMIKHVRDQVSNRFDGARYTAQDLAAQAEKILNDKQPMADCVAKVQEAAKVAGIALK